jgi:hypothetical protein
MLLSYDVIFLYVLRSGVTGRLTKGRIERDGSRLTIYAPDPSTNNEYLTDSLRSWSVVAPDGKPVGDWCAVLPEDRAQLPHLPD